MKLINQRSVFTWLTSLLIAMSLSACSGSSGPDDGGDGGTETFELVLGQAG